MAAADEATWKSCAQFCRQARGLIMSRGIEYTSWLQVVTLDLRPVTWIQLTGDRGGNTQLTSKTPY